MGCHPDWVKKEETVVVHGREVVRRYYSRKPVLKRVGDIAPGGCDGFIPLPADEAPPGLLCVTDATGAVIWLEPGTPGDYLRIANDGLPIWSPA